MAAFQIESDVCTGRGFSDTSPSGIMAKFYTWITKPPASGGPGWNILLDKSTQPVAVTSTAMVGSIITCSGHGFYTNDWVIYTSTGTAMGGISSATTYTIFKIDNNSFKLSTNRGTLANSGYLNITSSGTGTHSWILEGPYIIVSDTAVPQINQVCKFMKVGYRTSEGSYIRVQTFLGWDNTNKIMSSIWNGTRLETVDSSDFAYDFRGGPECMILQTRIGVDWDSCGIDTWTGDSNLVEGIDKSGVLRSAIVAGSGVVVSLNAGQATNFTSGEYYYMYDFSQPMNRISYAKVTNVSGSVDQITLEYVYTPFPSGSCIGSYPHRFYSWGNISNTSQIDLSSSAISLKIPYSSSIVSGYVAHNSISYIYGDCQASYEAGYILTMAPNDKNQYALEKINIKEYTRPNDYNSSTYTTSMNRGYGTSNNTFITALLSMARAQDGRSYGGKNYLYFMKMSEIIYGGGNDIAVLYPDTETTS